MACTAGVLAFTSSVLSLSLYHRTFTIPSRQASSMPGRCARSPQTAAETPAATSRTMLRLEVPCGITRLHKTIINDELLDKAVDAAPSALEVVLYSTVATNMETVAYLSDVYSTLWDLMLGRRKSHLDCTVHVCVEEDIPDLITAQPPVDLIMSDNLDDSALAARNNCRFQHLTSVLDGLQFPSDMLVFLDDPNIKGRKFRNVALGGTFDALHHGHKRLLTIGALICSGTLTVGISGDALLSKKRNKHLIQDYKSRTRRVEEFLHRLNLHPKISFRFVQLNEGMGPPAVEADFDALLISSETLVGGLMINQKRLEHGLPQLALCVLRRQAAATLSSTFVRDMKR